MRPRALLALLCIVALPSTGAQAGAGHEVALLLEGSGFENKGGEVQGPGLLLGFVSQELFPQSVTLSADHAFVTIHELDTAYLPGATVATGDVRSEGPFRLDGVTAHATANGLENYAWAKAEGAGLSLETAEANLRAVARAEFGTTVVSPVARPADSGEPYVFQEAIAEQPALSAAIHGSDGLRAVGDAQMHLYGLTLTIQSAQGPSTIETGTFPYDAGSPAQVGQTYRWATVHAVGLDLQVLPGLATVEAWWAEGHVTDATGVAVFSASGQVAGRDVAAGVLRADGSGFSGAVVPVLEGEATYVKADVHGRATQVLADGQPLDLGLRGQAVEPRLANSGWVFAVAAVVLAAIVAVTLLVRRRTDVDTLILRAEDAIGRDMPRRAYRLSRRALAKVPDDEDALALSAVALLRLGQAEKARALMERSLSNAGHERPVLRVLLAMSFLRQGHEDAATDHFRQALESDPDLVQDPRLSALMRRLGHDWSKVEDGASYA